MIQGDLELFKEADPDGDRRRRLVAVDLMECAIRFAEADSDYMSIRDLVRAQYVLSEGNLVIPFVRERFALGQRGHSVSSAEAWEEYRGGILRGVYPNLTEVLFHRKLAPAMMTVLGVKRSNGILRGGRKVRGYNKVAFQGVRK